MGGINPNSGAPARPGEPWYFPDNATQTGGGNGASPYTQQKPDPMAGKPLYPTLDSFIGGSPGSPKLLDNLVINPNWSTGFSGLQGIANAKPGQSTWEQMMLGKQGTEQASAMDASERGAATQRALGFSDLARRGGVSRGSARNIGRQSLSDLMMGRQDIARQGAGQRFQIGAQGEQNRMGALKDVMGTEMNTQQFNTQNLLTQKRLEDAAKLGKYSEEMKAWAANKQADATAGSGKK